MASKSIRRNTYVTDGQTLLEKEMEKSPPDYESIDLLSHFLKRLKLAHTFDLLKAKDKQANLEMFDYEHNRRPFDDDASEYFERMSKYLEKLGFSSQEVATLIQDAKVGNLVEREKEFINNEYEENRKIKPIDALHNFLKLLKLENYFENLVEREKEFINNEYEENR